MQLLENPGVHGIEYQQGTLHGREIREYLLELTGRKCAYCGNKRTRLEVEHIVIGCGVIANPKFDIDEANRQVNDVKLMADKNLSKTIHDFLIENPKASVADVKQGNSEYKVQYPVYSYSYKTNFFCL